MIPSMESAVLSRAHPAIRRFEELAAGDVGAAGGKGANLGELARAGLPVPPGFVVTADAFRAFLSAAGLSHEIAAALSVLDVDDEKTLARVTSGLQQRIKAASFPSDVKAGIEAAYDALGAGAGMPEPFVAVRSSATAEDAPGLSFAGMNETFLDVRGKVDLIEAVLGCWASLYGSRVVFYRRKQAVSEASMAMAVVVQLMVASDSAGVIFTVDPAAGAHSTLVVESAFGLGESVVSGAVSPDHWEIDKRTLTITAFRLADKSERVVRAAGGRTEKKLLEAAERLRPSLSAEQVLDLARLAVQIENHYRRPQDIEWAVAGGRAWILQARPMTGLAPEMSGPALPAEAEVLVRGLGASPGFATGAVRVLAGPETREQLLPGEVLVARKTEPDWAPVMKRASAIVTDEGGMTAHAAIVSRELGIPCVVGARDATTRLATGRLVAVDGKAGLVRASSAIGPATKALPREERPAEARAPRLVTATKLFVNCGQPELAEKMASLDVDGVGLLRIEFAINACTGGVHPRKMLSQGRGEEFRDRLAEVLARFARAFAPRIVVARTSDFRTNEYRGMTGGDEFEPVEENPMIGFRGVYRYVREPDLFQLELGAFHKVRSEMGLTNLALMLPFVRTPSELRTCKELIADVGLTRDASLPLWIMAEVPSVAYRLDDYVKEGVSGVSIGSNDLTQLMLGLDRDSKLVAPLFDERDAAVMGAIHDIVMACRRLGVTCSICGQAPSVFPEIMERLVAWGIDSISVSPDVVDRARRMIAATEQKLILEGARASMKDTRR